MRRQTTEARARGGHEVGPEACLRVWPPAHEGHGLGVIHRGIRPTRAGTNAAARVGVMKKELVLMVAASLVLAGAAAAHPPKKPQASVATATAKAPDHAPRAEWALLDER